MQGSDWIERIKSFNQLDRMIRPDPLQMLLNDPSPVNRNHPESSGRIIQPSFLAMNPDGVGNDSNQSVTFRKWKEDEKDGKEEEEEEEGIAELRNWGVNVP